MSTARWKKFPQTKPKKQGKYLCTCRNFAGVHVEILDWSERYKSFYNYARKRKNIIAWKELPEPYKPESGKHPDEITADKYMKRDPETLKSLGIFD